MILISSASSLSILRMPWERSSDTRALDESGVMPRVPHSPFALLAGGDTDPEPRCAGVSISCGPGVTRLGTCEIFTVLWHFLIPLTVSGLSLVSICAVENIVESFLAELSTALRLITSDSMVEVDLAELSRGELL